MEQFFEAPIPGQSLTSEPKNYPWERPPTTVDPNEAIVHYIEKISREDVTDDILDILQTGMPVGTLTDIMLTGGVMNGIHTVDMSLLIAPVVHEYILTIADAAGIEYKEFFSDEEEKQEQTKLAAVSSVLEELKKNRQKDEGAQYVEELMTQEPTEEQMVDTSAERSSGMMAGEQQQQQKEQPQGLMSRRS